MEKIVKKHISYKTLAVLAILAALIITFPLIYIGRFDVPSADDYSYSTDTYHAVLNGTSVFAAALNTVKRVFTTWQGTYSAVFMMSLQPSIFSFSAYSITPVIMIVSLAFGITALLISVSKYLGCSYTEKPIIIASIVIIICTQFIPSPVQGLYWYNGSIYYTFFFALALIEFALFFSYLKASKVYIIIIASILAFIIGGSNFSTALACSVINFGIIGIGLLRKNNNWKMLLIPSIICVIGLLISCLAPGNSVRQSEYTSHPSAVEAIMSSIISLPALIASWPNLITLGMIVFLFPFSIDTAKEMRIFIRYPLIYTVISYLILSVMICPTEYVFGSYGPPRMVNTVFFAYIILIAINELIWVRYFVQKTADSDVRLSTNIINIAVVSFVFLLLIGISVIVNNTSISSVTAVSEILSGEAETYYSEACDRQQKFEESSGLDMEIFPYSVQPYLLFFDDFSSDKDNWKNVDASTYFDINSITCQ